MADQMNCRVGARPHLRDCLQQEAGACAQAGSGKGFDAVNLRRHAGIVEQLLQCMVHWSPVSKISQIREAEEPGNEEYVSFHRYTLKPDQTYNVILLAAQGRLFCVRRIQNFLEVEQPFVETEFTQFPRVLIGRT
jgi:hypothetical protein